MVSPDFCRKVKENVTANFDQSLEAYQAFEDRYHFFADLSLALAQWIGLRPRSAVLDVGCGNGISAVALNARYGCRVTGVDLSSAMVEAGRRLLGDSNDIRLIVGDGDRLADVAGDERFDYVLYNASIFIFPEVANTIRSAAGVLRPGGEIAFSFYPSIVGPGGTDLLGEAFRRTGAPLPRARVITDYEDACAALQIHCGPVRRHQWTMPMDLVFLKDFFSIPAQSASLFPGQPYAERRSNVGLLFKAVADMSGQGTIVWPMAHSQKAL